MRLLVRRRILGSWGAQQFSEYKEEIFKTRMSTTRIKLTGTWRNNSGTNTFSRTSSAWYSENGHSGTDTQAKFSFCPRQIVSFILKTRNASKEQYWSLSSLGHGSHESLYRSNLCVSPILQDSAQLSIGPQVSWSEKPSDRMRWNFQCQKSRLLLC